MGTRERRTALGWDRAELARRAGVDRAALQLIERDAWTDPDALARVAEVLDRAEKGERDVALPAPTLPRRTP